MQDFKISLTDEDQMDIIQGYHSLQLENNRLKAEIKRLQDAEDAHIMEFEIRTARNEVFHDLCSQCPRAPEDNQQCCDLYRICDFHRNADRVFDCSYDRDDHLWFHKHELHYFFDEGYSPYTPDGFYMDFDKYSTLITNDEGF